MGEWELTRELRDIVKPMVEEYIKWLENKSPEENDEGLKLSHTGINPIQLEQLLEEMGYEESALDTNGWDYQYWWYVFNSEKDNGAAELCICGCAMCHDINLKMS